MKTAIVSVLVATSFGAFAQSHYVQPYVNKNGTYVEGHYQTNPNGTKLDNYSTQGNTNPYTGQAGTVDPYKAQNPYQQQPQCFVNQHGQTVCK